jgi:hypothetical protein
MLLFNLSPMEIGESAVEIREKKLKNRSGSLLFKVNKPLIEVNYQDYDLTRLYSQSN